MITLKQLVPLNLESEKQKFFNLKCKYDPQFVYEEKINVQDLAEHGLPQSHIVDLAKKVVLGGMAGKTEDELSLEKGRLLSQEEVTAKIKSYLRLHSLEDKFGLIWSNSFLARTSITATTIKLKSPSNYREDGLLSMLNHEIGTHALRRVNYEQQPWFKKKKKFGFGNYLKTEEGLAVLHALLASRNKFAHSSALRYLAVAEAQVGSFQNLHQFFSHYISDPEKRWRATFRRKIGLTDTSLPGGYTKDLVYFEGLVEVWRYLSENNFDPTLLYFGKLAWQDAVKALEINPDYQPNLPYFYKNDPEEYKKQLQMIGRTNYLD